MIVGTCFTLGWLAGLIVWAIVVGAAVMILRLLLPLVLGWFGVVGGTIAAVVDILLKAFIAIVVVLLIFDVLACLLGAGGTPFPWPRY